MPELPEVETVKRGLEKLIIGKSIKSVNNDWPKSFPNDPALVSEFMVGGRVNAVRRRAKVLLVDLDSGYTLMIHLKMTGQLVYIGKERFGAGHPNESLVGILPDKSTRVTILFTDGTNLYFNDQRKFGWMKLLPAGLVIEEPFMLKVGPEPLEPEFTDKIFITRVRKRANTSIKAAILDQTILAGIGNIYADESLWGSKINPVILVKNVSDEKLKKLHKEILFVLNLAIEKGGSTDKNYVNAEGGRGSYIDFARVFRRENLPCPRCDEIIVKTRVAGRGTHTCPQCQKA